MPFEIISGVIGSTVAELMSRLLPPRKMRGSSSEFLKTFERHHRWLYRGLLTSFFLGIFVPLFIFAPEADGRVHGASAATMGFWLLGGVFGSPFLLALSFVIATRFTLGRQQAKDLIRYFELKEKKHIYLYFVLTAILAPIGLVSLIFLCRARMVIG